MVTKRDTNFITSSPIPWNSSRTSVEFSISSWHRIFQSIIVHLSKRLACVISFHLQSTRVMPATYRDLLTVAMALN